MAISHVQPLLLLLAAIFFLPALCIDVDFEYCNKSGYDFGNITRVQYNPSTGMLVPSNVFIFGYARNFNIKVVTVSLKLDNSKLVVVKSYDNVRLFDSDPSTGHYTLYLPGVRGSYIPTKKYKIAISYIDDSEEAPKTAMCVEYAQILGGQTIL